MKFLEMVKMILVYGSPIIIAILIFGGLALFHRTWKWLIPVGVVVVLVVIGLAYLASHMVVG